MNAQIPMLLSVDAVIDAIGGTGKTATAIGMTAQAVSNWRMRSKIPPDYFLVVSKALEEVGARASPEVFGMKPPFLEGQPTTG